MPITFGAAWWTWPVIVAASVAGGLWLPESSLLKAKEQRLVAAAEGVKEQKKAAEEIREALKVAEKAAAPDTEKTGAADVLAARRLAALEKLEEELRTGKIDVDKAREESARTLEEGAADSRSDPKKRSERRTRRGIASRN